MDILWAYFPFSFSADIVDISYDTPNRGFSERHCFDSYRDLYSACCRLDSHGNIDLSEEEIDAAIGNGVNFPGRGKFPGASAYQMRGASRLGSHVQSSRT